MQITKDHLKPGATFSVTSRGKVVHRKISNVGAHSVAYARWTDTGTKVAKDFSTITDFLKWANNVPRPFQNFTGRRK